MLLNDAICLAVQLDLLICHRPRARQTVRLTVRNLMFLDTPVFAVQIYNAQRSFMLLAFASYPHSAEFQHVPDVAGSHWMLSNHESAPERCNLFSCAA